MPTIHSKFNPNILPSCEKVYIWYNQLDSSDESGGDKSLIDINAEEANSALPSIYFGLSIAPVLFCKCVNNELKVKSRSDELLVNFVDDIPFHNNPVD